MIRGAVSAAILLAAGPASAEVISANPNGFELRHEVEIAAPPSAVWARLGRIGTWWNPAHSYGGKADGLSLSLTLGGCFCERLSNGGGVEHMRVAYADPDKSLVLTGGLGPLLYEAVAGVLEIKLSPQGSGTRMVATYRAAGFARGNAAGLAPAVDRVLGEQWARLEAVSEGRRP